MLLARAFLVTLALGILWSPPASVAQQAGKVYRIGYLVIVTTPEEDAFRQRLRELGYLEGRNIIVDYRNAEGRYERLPDLASELVSLKPDLIVVATGPGTEAVKKTTTTIPIVMVNVVDPVGTGLVASLSRPGG